MDEQQATPQQDVPATPTTIEPSSAAPSEQTGAAPVEPDLDGILDKIDAAKLRKHPRIAGIVGNELQRGRQQWETEYSAKQEADARKKMRDELRDMARTRPVEFAETWLNEEDRNDFLNQLDSAKRDALNTFASYVGRAYNDLPEWGELSQDEREKVLSAVAQAPDDQAVAVANKAVIEIVAERRAAKRFEQRWQKELDKEREAIRKEEAAKLLQSGSAPDMRRSSPPSGFDPTTLPDDKFQEWYQKNVLSKL